MSDDELEDPAASTQMFQAFMDRPREPEPRAPRWPWVALVAVAVAIVVALVWLTLGG